MLLHNMQNDTEQRKDKTAPVIWQLYSTYR